MNMNREERELLDEANYLVEKARQIGYILTIDRVPLQPLSMGNHQSRVTLSPNKDWYRSFPNDPGAIHELG